MNILVAVAVAVAAALDFVDAAAAEAATYDRRNRMGPQRSYLGAPLSEGGPLCPLMSLLPVPTWSVVSL